MKLAEIYEGVAEKTKLAKDAADSRKEINRVKELVDTGTPMKNSNTVKKGIERKFRKMVKSQYKDISGDTK